MPSMLAKLDQIRWHQLRAWRILQTTLCQFSSGLFSRLALLSTVSSSGGWRSAGWCCFIFDVWTTLPGFDPPRVRPWRWSRWSSRIDYNRLLRAASLEFLVVHAQWQDLEAGPSDHFKDLLAMAVALGRWSLWVHTRRFPECHPAGSGRGTASEARGRLVLPAVVVVRGSRVRCMFHYI